jgi:hypothetical protein
MDYTSLNEITETIIHLIQDAIVTPSDFVVPELLTKETEGISFYLFHVLENSHYKNYPPAGIDYPPVAITPMGLNLYYQLTCNKKKENGEDAYEEQRLMSIAMKALHDQPVLKRTRPNAALGYPQGKEIDIKIALQTLTPSESVQYWAAAESAARLSAYYEVSVVFLPPETVKSVSGRVLSYGNFIFTENAPRITATESTLEYLVPGDPNPRQVKIQPAQAKVPASAPPSISNKVTFYGSGFTGSNFEIRIISPLWDVPALAGSGWNVSRVSESQLEMTLQSTAILMKSLVPKDIIPGLYSSQVCKTEQRMLPNGTTKKFEHLSNLFPFSVIPRIDSVVPGAPGAFAIKGYLFQHADITQDDIQVYTGDQLLLPAIAPLTPGTFKITAPDTINLVGSPLVHGLVPLKIMVRGIESEPKWITLP